MKVVVKKPSTHLSDKIWCMIGRYQGQSDGSTALLIPSQCRESAMLTFWQDSTLNHNFTVMGRKPREEDLFIVNFSKEFELQLVYKER